MKDHPEPNEGWLQYFRRKRQFSDCILFAWSEIEFNLDQIVARQFGLFIDDTKAKILLRDLTIQKKLDFLKEIYVITKDEYNIIKKFQEYRNKLFHGKQPFFFNLSDKEKDEVMDNAVNAAELTLVIGFRKAVA